MIADGNRKFSGLLLAYEIEHNTDGIRGGAYSQLFAYTEAIMGFGKTCDGLGQAIAPRVVSNGLLASDTHVEESVGSGLLGNVDKGKGKGKAGAKTFLCLHFGHGANGCKEGASCKYFHAKPPGMSICYECGLPGHAGDDCPNVPVQKRLKAVLEKRAAAKGDGKGKGGAGDQKGPGN